ncbi:MAG: sugar phosphate nucleotidyltransferase [Pseudomonadota bacterium]|nr:sugar phosphate nucleotidyltransferase [Pseudomonadota bacterium]
MKRSDTPSDPRSHAPSDSTFAVVLAGGRGTRFWPLSRRALPKQCLSLGGGPTLLQQTVSRTGLPNERVLVVTGPDMAGAVRDQLPGVDLLVEPSPRNTAAAIAWAALEVERRGGSECFVLPSDHVITDEPAFRTALATAATVAESGALVTLGVRPTRPETGFGWIEMGEGDGSDCPVMRFVEKPPREDAERFLAGGRHVWNAGMFVWSPEALLDAVAAYLPGTTAMIKALRRGSTLADVWGLSEATSIDYGVMERASGIRVLPVKFGWSDVGSWSALLEVLPLGEGGAAIAEEVIAIRASGNVVHAAGKLVALLGVNDLIVVDTPDAMLVAPVGEAQNVRLLLEEVERRKLGRYA